MYLIVDKDIGILRKEMAKKIIRAANEAIGLKGCFNIAVAGGSLIESLYVGLSKSDGTTEYDKWNVFMVDERLVPLDHKDSNYGALKAKFLLNSNLAQCNLLPVDTSLDVNAAANDYSKKIPSDGLDLAVFGMGSDGHIASLFPGLFQDIAVPCIPIDNSPKPPPTRVTLSLGYLKRCKGYVFMITGAEKKEAMAKVLQADPSLPSSHLDQSLATWFVDKLCIE